MNIVSIIACCALIQIGFGAGGPKEATLQQSPDLQNWSDVVTIYRVYGEPGTIAIDAPTNSAMFYRFRWQQ